MTEQTSNPLQSGLNPNFRLAPVIRDALAMNTAPVNPNNIMHDSAAAANRLYGRIDALEYAATHDSLTDLLNKKEWMKDLQAEIDSLQEGDELIVYAADLDNFTQINTEFGHPGGDRLLQGPVTKTLNRVFQRSTDKIARGSRNDSDVARLGGDEFGIISHANAEHVQNNRRITSPADRAESQGRLLNDALAEELVGTDFEHSGLSFSLGQATYEPGDTAETLLFRADMDAYRVKYLGKAENIPLEKIAYFREAIPHFEAIGQKIQPWLKQAVGL